VWQLQVAPVQPLRVVESVQGDVSGVGHQARPSARANPGGPDSATACRREAGGIPPATERVARGMARRQALKTVLGGAAAWDAGVGALTDSTTGRVAEAARPRALRVAAAHRGVVATLATVATGARTAEGPDTLAPACGIQGTIVATLIALAGAVEALPVRAATLALRVYAADLAALPRAAPPRLPAQGGRVVGKGGEQWPAGKGGAKNR
jgi:hypothetical protein